MEARLSLVTLGVNDLSRARTFYAVGLGLPLQPQSTDEVAFFGLRGVWLALWSRAALAGDAGVPAEGSGFRGIALAHNVRTKPDVDALLAQVERAGGRIVRPAQEVAWGGYTGYFADPDGHLWEVAYNPHFWIE
jgi:catechol 2,3-dioxygenase-like lactoylglutathione lyase family enzyme